MSPERLAALLRPWLGSGAAYVALAAGVRGLALDGRLALGTRLPSERLLAAALGVSRTTVTAAYDVLRAEGYLRSDRGAGSRLALPGDLPARPDAEPGERPDLLDLSVAALAAPAQLVEAVERAASALRPLLAGHGLHPLGVPALRAAVARHLTARGLPTRPEQVLVTSGALQGWNLVLAALSRPGDRVLVEQPTYPGVLDAVAAARRRPSALPVTAAGWELADGPSPSAIALAHVTPDGQNPTGLLATTAQRRALLERLAGTTVVVDETFADLVLDGPSLTPMAALAPGVITLGSMSKAFWAGLRIGWVRADPDVLRRLAQGRAGQDLASPVLEQLVAVELLARAPEILAERQQRLRQSRDALLGELAVQLPGWRCSTPAAGMVLWAELPEDGVARATQLASHALDLGARVTPGPRFTIDGTADRFLRLPFTLPAESMPDVARLLVEAQSRLATGRVPTRTPTRWTA